VDIKTVRPEDHEKIIQKRKTHLKHPMKRLKKGHKVPKGNGIG